MHQIWDNLLGIILSQYEFKLIFGVKVMKEIWVLSVKTSLPNTCCNSAEMETTFTGYKSFTDARDDLRCILRNFAFSKNSMFDGKGNITKLSILKIVLMKMMSARMILKFSILPE